TVLLEIHTTFTPAAFRALILGDGQRIKKLIGNKEERAFGQFRHGGMPLRLRHTLALCSAQRGARFDQVNGSSFSHARHGAERAPPASRAPADVRPARTALARLMKANDPQSTAPQVRQTSGSLRVLS